MSSCWINQQYQTISHMWELQWYAWKSVTFWVIYAIDLVIIAVCVALLFYHRNSNTFTVVVILCHHYHSLGKFLFAYQCFWGAYSMMLHSFLLVSYWITKGVTGSGGSHCFLELIDQGGQWFLGYSDWGLEKPCMLYRIARFLHFRGYKVG